MCLVERDEGAMKGVLQLLLHPRDTKFAAWDSNHSWDSKFHSAGFVLSLGGGGRVSLLTSIGILVARMDSRMARHPPAGRDG